MCLKNDCSNFSIKDFVPMGSENYSDVEVDLYER